MMMVMIAIVIAVFIDDLIAIESKNLEIGNQYIGMNNWPFSCFLYSSLLLPIYHHLKGLVCQELLQALLEFHCPIQEHVIYNASCPYY